MGCRNTVFNAQAQSGADYIPQLAAAGVGSLRIELVDEPAELVGPLLEGYAAVARGERTARSLMEWMQALPDANGADRGADGCGGVSRMAMRARLRARSDAPP